MVWMNEWMKSSPLARRVTGWETGANMLMPTIGFSIRIDGMMDKEMVNADHCCYDTACWLRNMSPVEISVVLHVRLSLHWMYWIAISQASHLLRYCWPYYKVLYMYYGCRWLVCYVVSVHVDVLIGVLTDLHISKNCATILSAKAACFSVKLKWKSIPFVKVISLTANFFHYYCTICRHQNMWILAILFCCL